MSELLLVNPIRRRRRKTRKAARRNPIRRAAAPRNHRRVRRNPVSMHNPTSNPRRRRSHRRHHRAALRNPIVRHHRRHHRRLRRNPIGSYGFSIKGLFKPAIYGAVGAVASDYLYSMVAPMLPTSLTTGTMSYLARAGVAVGTAWATSKVSKEAAGDVGVGALTVVFRDLLRSFLPASMAPTLSAYNLNGAFDINAPGPMRINNMAGVSPAQNLQGVYMPTDDLSGMGAYL